MTTVPPESARFTVLIPARLGSTRLPRKALADIGGVPMVVRVAQQAQRSQASRTVVACDSPEIMACCAHWGIAALLTDSQHASGSDRLAQASQLLGLADHEIVVNVQGDEPLIAPPLIDAVAQVLQARSDCVMSTAAHALNSPAEFHSPHVVKVVLDAQQRALYFSRAPIPATRDAKPGTVLQTVPDQALRHVGIYSYRAGFLRQFPQLPAAPLEQQESLEQLRVLWHGYRIAVHVSAQTPGAGVDTPEDLEQVRQGFLHTRGL